MSAILPGLQAFSSAFNRIAMKKLLYILAGLGLAACTSDIEEPPEVGPQPGREVALTGISGTASRTQFVPGDGTEIQFQWSTGDRIWAGGEQRAGLFFPLHRNHLFVVCAQPTAGVQPGRFAPVLMIREKSRIIYKKMLPHTNLLPGFEKGAFCRGRAAAKHTVVQSREIRSSQIRAAVVQYSVISNSFTTSVS